MRRFFDTDGVRGKVGLHPIDSETVAKLSRAFAKVFKAKTVVVGRDTRESGKVLEAAIANGLKQSGTDVLLAGVIPTPAVAYLTKHLNADGGIVISASHNPAEENGLKFFSNKGLKLEDSKEEEIEKVFFSGDFDEGTGKTRSIENAAELYVKFLEGTFGSKTGLKIVVDCANGAASTTAPAVFRNIGAEVIAINNNPNGKNINLDCGAVHPEKAGKAVVENNADVGIALDGDADRVIMVDEKGSVVDGDQIIAMIALDMLKKGRLMNKTVVVTNYSNLGLDKAINKAGGKVVRVKTGDRYVAEEMLKHNYSFGGEQSGHLIFSDFGAGDGTLSALQVIKLAQKSKKRLSELVSCIELHPHVLVSVDVREKKDLNEVPSVRQKIEETEKMLRGKGRLFIRYSGTQNKLRIMVEGKDKEEIKNMANSIAETVKNELS